MKISFTETQNCKKISATSTKTSFMKRLYFFIVILTICFQHSGCDKNNASENYLRGTMDGQAFECTSGISANEPEPIPGSGDDPTLRLTGSWSTYSLKLMLIGEGTITNGTYVFESGKQRSATLLLTTGDSYYAGNDGIFGTGQLRGSGSITITDISKKHVKGNFQFVAVDLASGNSKTVTNGAFSIDRN